MFKKLGGMFGKNDDDEKIEQKPEEPIGVLPEYLKWREFIFSVKPEAVGFDPSGGHKVYGIIMDVGLANNDGTPSPENLVISVSAFYSLECSMRTSFGGGLTGVGAHPPIKQQLKLILPLAEKLHSTAKPESQPSMPASGNVYFHYLTADGLYLYAVPISDVMNRSHPYAELFARFSQVKAIVDQLWDAQQGKKPQ